MIHRTGHLTADLIAIGAVALQGVSFGINPSTTQAISSLALLGVAVIGVWTANKTAKIKKVVDDTQKVAVATHTLSNSAMGAQLLNNVQTLESLSVFAHRLAESNNPSDIAAAVAIDVRVEAAKAEYQEHVKKQAVVDSKGM
jgi:phosphoribosylanthranilate isomerase